MFGVAPAYFISRFGDRFTCQDVAGCLADLRDDGFSAFQPEVYHPENLVDWQKKGAALIARSASDSGLAATQFVAHFLLHGFESAAALSNGLGAKEAERALEGLEHFPACRVFTVPLPAAPEEPDGGSALRQAFVDKLGAILEVVEGSGRRLALEIMPGSLFAGIQGFLRLCEALGDTGLAYNFDTGHAWASGDYLPGIPAVAGSRILGTHLKDGLAGGTPAVAPGAGAIPWQATIAALVASGYRGGWDIEFRCPAEGAREQYSRALDFLKPLVEQVRAARKE